MKKYKISFFLNTFIICAVSINFLSSCSKKNYSQNKVYQFKSSNNLPDYSNLSYWAAHPWKKDLSDSVPGDLQNSFLQDSIADVFFIHPTTLTSSKNKNWNAAIDDAVINYKTDYSTILYQASVFNEKCRVFAPRYRQANIRAFYEHGENADNAFEIAYEDVKKAFEYYLIHYNHGRPIIIASHSQGTKHASRLLKEFFDNKPLQKQLVCAYIIGMPVPDDYFTRLQPCKDSTATGCFITWRTFKRNSTETSLIASEKFKSIVINPLSWTMQTDLITSSKNKGAVLKNFNKVVIKVCNAQIHNNILWASKPNIPGKIFFTRTNYHIGDINLFYMNIRENTVTRINAWLQKQ